MASPLSVSNTLSSISISEADVYYTLTSLDPNKAMGSDKIGPRVLKSCADVLTKPLFHLFSISIRYAVVPHQWKIHKVIPGIVLNLAIAVQSNAIILYHY